jgi:hypothetical protein
VNDRRVSIGPGEKIIAGFEITHHEDGRVEVEHVSTGYEIEVDSEIVVDRLPPPKEER